MNLAPIKTEFVRKDAEKVLSDQYLSEKDKQAMEDEATKKLSGKNKKRQLNNINNKQCKRVARGETCPFGESCKYSHETQVENDTLKLNCVFSKYSGCPYGPACMLEHHDQPPSAKTYESTIHNLFTAEARNIIKNTKQSKRINVEHNVTENDTKNSTSVKSDGEARRRVVDFRDKLYLAPLATVGNLPFRRVCVGMGAQITCSEMTVSTSLLAGKQSDWAMVKRHQSEKIFGIQLCGGHVDSMSDCARIFDDPYFSVDFLDINVGCPIDCIYKKGFGSALLGKPNRLIAIVDAMTAASGLPVSVKMRTGVSDSNNVVASIVRKLESAGSASLFTIHGRSREQRYSKKADWETVSRCVDVAGNIPVFGNGDILSFQDYEARRAQIPSLAGVVIGRGALIKPWIFTEIVERRNWDISSKERFGILEKYRDYALEHWGSDRRGVETSRKFLLEWLSFLHRYIPVGLLERLPQDINVRPPPYYGRDDLETLMASSNCADWIKISELLLGPVPDGFRFLPKHRANAYQPLSGVDISKLYAA